MPIYAGSMIRFANLLLVLLLAVASIAAGISTGVHAEGTETVAVVDTHSGPAGADGHMHDGEKKTDECSTMTGHCFAEVALPPDRIIHVVFGEVVRRLAVDHGRWGNAILCADPPPPRA